LRAEHKEDTTLWSAVEADDCGETWCIIDDIIMLRGHPFIVVTSPLLQSILVHAHGVGHEGTEKTLHRLRADFHIPGARGLVREFVHACEIYQWNKGEQLRPTGLLQSLDIPSAVWDDMVMDFVEGFSHINRKSVILTVVDRLSSTCTSFRWATLTS
jgi:hypothetical protein